MTRAEHVLRQPGPLGLQVREFFDHLEVSKKHSANTLAAYANDLNQFARFLERQGDTDWAITRASVTGFLEYLVQREYKPSSQARKLAAVKALFRFLVENRTVSLDPTEGVGGARVAKKRPTVISIAEVDRLLAEAGSSRSPEGYRDSAMLELLYATGMRVSELVALNLQDLSLEAGLVVCGRGSSREREVPFGPRVVEVLNAYMRGARRQLLKSADEEGLFLNHRGRRLTRQGFWLIIKGHARTSRIETPITPHTLRHSFATHRLRGDGTVLEVQSLLGHASPATTQIYLEMAREKGALEASLPGSDARRPH